MNWPLPTADELLEKEFFVACLCADWCDTCRDYQDAFRQLSAKFPQAAFAWVDIEDEAERVDDYDVENFPTLLIQRGELVLFVGVVPPPYAKHAERLVAEFLAQTPEQSAAYAAATDERRRWQNERNLWSLLVGTPEARLRVDGE